MSSTNDVYTVKELLLAQSTKLDRIERKLELKADRARVHEIITEISNMGLKIALLEQHVPSPAQWAAMEERVGRLEFDRAGRQALASWQRWVIGIFFGGIGAALLAGVVTVLLKLAGG